MFVSLGRDLQILHAYSFGRDLHILHICLFGRDLHVLNVCHSVWVVTYHMFACGLHSFFNHSLAYLCLSWEIHASELRGGKAVCFSNRVCLCRIYMDVLPNTLLFFCMRVVSDLHGAHFDLCMKGPRALGFHVGSGFSLSVLFLSPAYIIFTREILVFIVAC